MSGSMPDDDLVVMSENALAEARSAGDEDVEEERPAIDGHGDLEALRDAFVEAFNARDLEALLALIADDVDCPDLPGDGGRPALAEEICDVWERSPVAILTRARLDEVPCAVGWLPDEGGRWSRAALVVLDGEDSTLTLVGVPDDADALDRADAEDPTGEELEEWCDWGEWDSGAETPPAPRR